MKTETRTITTEQQIFIAFDGAEFLTEVDCARHERENGDKRLVGLTAEQIAASLSGEDRELGDAIEDPARRIAQARRDRGDLKRRPNAKGDSSANVGEITQ